MKAWRCEYYGDDWCMFFHAETRDDARRMFLAADPTMNDAGWAAIRAVRETGLDGKAFLWRNFTLTQIKDYMREWGRDGLGWEARLADCPCEVCDAARMAERIGKN